jgi:3-oxoacyl-[acyl-carrier protein] reductase
MGKNFWIQFICILCLFHNICIANSPVEIENPKTLLITCASGELGGAAARLLARNHHLILTGRNLSVLQKLQNELRANHPWNYEIKILNYTSSPSIAHFRDDLNQTDSSIAGLVLITPRPQFDGKTFFQDECAWLENFQTTFTGPLEVLKAVIPHLSRQSKIVVIAGTTSVQFQPEVGCTCVIRRMWTTCCKALSHQLGPQGISVNALSPGVVLTNFHRERIQKKAQENGLNYDDQMEEEVSNIPLHRHAKPQEVAQTIKFLLSEESDFINGTNLILDGGLTVTY